MSESDDFEATMNTVERVGAVRERVPDIKKLMECCHEQSSVNGWHDPPREDGTVIALIHSELSEALEDLREDRTGYYVRSSDDKPIGLATELADAIIRIMDYAEDRGIPLHVAFADKFRYNEKREYRHGGKEF